jgi:hypothetical protein
MLKHGQVLEVQATLFGSYRVVDRFTDEAGVGHHEAYECADSDELLSVLDALGCDFEKAQRSD